MGPKGANMNQWVALTLCLSGCTQLPTQPPKSCDQSQVIGECDFDRVYEHGNIVLVPAERSGPYCAKIIIGIRMADSMEGPWVWKTYFTQPGERITLPPGIGETNPQSCTAYAPQQQ